MRLLLLAACLLLTGCRTTGGGKPDPLPLFTEMSEEETTEFVNDWSTIIGLAAIAVIQEGDTTPERVEEVLGIVRGVVDGRIAASGLVAALDLDGYKALGVQLLLLRFDRTIAASGGILDGVLSPEAREIIGSVADGVAAMLNAPG